MKKVQYHRTDHLGLFEKCFPSLVDYFLQIFPCTKRKPCLPRVISVIFSASFVLFQFRAECPAAGRENLREVVHFPKLSPRLFTLLVKNPLAFISAESVARRSRGSQMLNRV